MKNNRNIAQLIDDQQNNKEAPKEISITALMTVREMLGWSKKTLMFTGKNLTEFIKQIITKDGETLYNVLVQKDGAVKPEYMVWLNNRPVKPEHSLKIPLESGDRIVVMPIIRFAAGG